MILKSFQNWLKELCLLIILSSLIILPMSCETSNQDVPSYRKYSIAKGCHILTTEGWHIMEYKAIVISEAEYFELVEK